MPAWNPNLRSKTSIRTTDTRYFVDPSIATAALSIGPNDLMNDLNTLGLFFETLCVRDLRVFAQALDGNVFHYRDKTGLECDTVVHLRNGDYGLIEIKIGGDKLIEEGAANLKKTIAKDRYHKNEIAFFPDDTYRRRKFCLSQRRRSICCAYWLPERLDSDRM